MTLHCLLSQITLGEDTVHRFEAAFEFGGQCGLCEQINTGNGHF